MAERVLDTVVTEDLRAVRGIIAKSRAPGGEGIPSLYRAVLGELADGTRNSPAQIAMLDAYEQAVGVFRAAAIGLRTDMDVLTLEQRLDAQRQALAGQAALATPPTPEATGTIRTAIDTLQHQLTDAVFFSNRYALAFAGHVGLAALGAEPIKTENRFTFGPKYDVSIDRDALTAKLAEQAAADLTRVTEAQRVAGETPSDDSLRTTLANIFTSWTNQFQWPTFRETAAKRGAEDLTLRYGNYSIRAGEFKRKYDTITVDDKFMQITRDDVIAPGRLGEVLWDNLKLLSAYNHERNRNPYSPASTIFTQGPPGCGKTFTSHGYVRSFAALCRERGIPLWALTHSTTDYASHYQNLTANQLSALAGQINAFPGAVVMYVADADNVFLSRDDPHLTAEQRQTLSVYFKMFDGSLIPKNGKFLAIMDTNYTEGIDEATKSRVFDEVVVVDRFTRVEDFAALAKRALTKGTDGVILPESDWQEVGMYLLQSPLSNREISHVFGKLRRVTISDDMVGQPDEVHAGYWQEQMRDRLTKEGIVAQFETYIRSRQEIELASLKDMVEDRRTRWLKNLTTVPTPPSGSAG